MNFREEMMHLHLGECLTCKCINEIDALSIYLTIFKFPYVVEACCWKTFVNSGGELSRICLIIKIWAWMVFMSLYKMDILLSMISRDIF
jgi:hypothetical protein